MFNLEQIITAKKKQQVICYHCLNNFWSCLFLQVHKTWKIISLLNPLTTTLKSDFATDFPWRLHEFFHCALSDYYYYYFFTIYDRFNKWVDSVEYFLCNIVKNETKAFILFFLLSPPNQNNFQKIQWGVGWNKG